MLKKYKIVWAIIKYVKHFICSRVLKKIEAKIAHKFVIKTVACILKKKSIEIRSKLKDIANQLI